jgi:pimeloyl-ACP methyl ester carboxylesterase/SAM-dependent methyltransferase
MNAERILPINGAELCVQTFGDPAHPALLLIAGAASSMDWWDAEFCTRLADGLRFVIRYDQRDTGRSTSYPPGEPGYTGPDLADDALGILDALDTGPAHLIGMSAGGALALYLGVHHPDRVASLTLMSTTAGGPDLPPPTLSGATESDPVWSDPDAVVEYIVRGTRALAGPGYFDEDGDRATARRAVARTANPQSASINHYRVDGGGSVRARLGEIAAPTLVVHGTADPLFPIAHGEALASEIPGAELLRLPGVGHQMPPREIWPTLIPALLRHTSGGWDPQAERLAARYLAAGDPAGWFNPLYRAATEGEVAMPWDRTEPHPLLAQWAAGRDGTGRRAVVVGCGLGADAEFLAGRGYDTVGFDIAPAAVAIARDRHPDTTVDYAVANLLDLPEHWRHGFDLVVDIYTVQALPREPRPAAIAGVGSLVAPGGTLLVIQVCFEEAYGTGGPPWPLRRDEIESFAVGGLQAVRVEQIEEPGRRIPRWRAEFTRPAGE